MNRPVFEPFYESKGDDLWWRGFHAALFRVSENFDIIVEDGSTARHVGWRNVEEGPPIALWEITNLSGEARLIQVVHVFAALEDNLEEERHEHRFH